MRVWDIYEEIKDIHKFCLSYYSVFVSKIISSLNTSLQSISYISVLVRWHFFCRNKDILYLFDWLNNSVVGVRYLCFSLSVNNKRGVLFFCCTELAWGLSSFECCEHWFAINYEGNQLTVIPVSYWRRKLWLRDSFKV